MYKKCLFLGYKKNQTSLFYFLRKKNFKIKNFQKIPPLKEFQNSDLIVSFGFRKIINENIIKIQKKKLLCNNLHR